MKDTRHSSPRRTARLARLVVAGAATTSGAILLGYVLTLTTGPLLAVAAGLVLIVAALIVALPMLDVIAPPPTGRPAVVTETRGPQPQLTSRH